MKKKDIIYLVFTVVILLGGGYLAYTQLFKSKSAAAAKAGTQVEVVGSIKSSLDDTSLSVLNDVTKVQDFSPAVDLTGLGNPAPFNVQ